MWRVEAWASQLCVLCMLCQPQARRALAGTSHTLQLPAACSSLPALTRLITSPFSSLSVGAGCCCWGSLPAAEGSEPARFSLPAAPRWPPRPLPEPGLVPGLPPLPAPLPAPASAAVGLRPGLPPVPAPPGARSAELPRRACELPLPCRPAAGTCWGREEVWERERERLGASGGVSGPGERARLLLAPCKQAGSVGWGGVGGGARHPPLQRGGRPVPWQETQGACCAQASRQRRPPRCPAAPGAAPRAAYRCRRLPSPPCWTCRCPGACRRGAGAAQSVGAAGGVVAIIAARGASPAPPILPCPPASPHRHAHLAPAWPLSEAAYGTTLRGGGW